MPDDDAAARRDGRHGVVGLPQRDRLIAVARELGDGAESAEAPLRIGIADRPPQQIDRRSMYRSLFSAFQPDNSVMCGPGKPARRA
jgi:hypothetical protein